MFQAFETRDCSGAAIHDGPLEVGKCFPVSKATYSYRATLSERCFLALFSDSSCDDADNDGESDWEEARDSHQLSGDMTRENNKALQLTDRCFNVQTAEKVPDKPEEFELKDATLWSVKVLCPPPAEDQIKYIDPQTKVAAM